MFLYKITVGQVSRYYREINLFFKHDRKKLNFKVQLIYTNKKVRKEFENDFKLNYLYWHELE